MMSTRRQLESFYRFALEHTGKVSNDELYAAWRSRQLEAKERQESLIALSEASAELDRGNVGVSAKDVVAGLRRELGLEPA